MPEGGSEAKSPSTARRLRSRENLQQHTQQQQAQQPPRQVRFDDAGARDCQPASFPQLGPDPSAANATRWYTAADATRSVCQPPYSHHANARAAHGFYQHAPPQQHPVTYIGQHPLPHHPWAPSVVAAMADYANAGPPPAGVNFQPPVPDSTFGPMPHVYVPRFDGPPVHGFPQPVVGHQQGYVVAPQPVFAAQPVVAQPQQPIMINGQAYVPAVAAGQSFAGGGPPVFHQMHGGVAAHAGPVPIFAGNGSQVPDVSGVGRTPNEEMLRQVQFAFSNKLFEPQDFKPHDDDPSRFYYVREVDGNWTQRNRYTIDQMPCRWYVTDEGWFYAVRLPE